MDIQAEINWIHQEIDKVKDPSFIEKMKHLLQSINSNREETNIDYNNDIDNALENIKNGNFYTDEEAISISKTWGRK
ncbi:hypothetical protein [Flavobacterium sp. 5]|uniref:hypothetical protein n=1 Tax=Flavobacterium sp. 5 TaxID=2035199 RepID=UPI000C2BD51C|nr:hypothetical protein [Flavobacterium sp. 5]PKB15432.1 hypothetical protein CLU82_0506 [Flavobacterium sp. 5]